MTIFCYSIIVFSQEMTHQGQQDRGGVPVVRMDGLKDKVESYTKYLKDMVNCGTLAYGYFFSFFTVI